MLADVTTEMIANGRAFIEREGRLIERRLAAVLYDGADPSGVVDAVRAYRNADGGFGHGFEPDNRCPASLPIDVECASTSCWFSNVMPGEAASGSTACFATHATGWAQRPPPTGLCRWPFP